MKRWIVPVTTISMIIGALVAVQYKSQVDAKQLSPSRRVEDLVFMLKSTEKANQQLSDQVTQLQERLHGGGAGGGTDTPQLVSDTDTVAAYPAMAGAGLLVTIEESSKENQFEEGTSAIVHAEDLLKIVNELRAGGAEAMAVNGHRLTELSEVVTAGQHVMVNGTAINAPYVIVAIGPASEMKTTLALRGGVTEYLQFYGIEVKATSAKHLEVPAAEGLGPFRFARPAPPKG